MARGDGRAVLAAVALGGALGAAARYGVTVGWPMSPGGFPFATLGVNLAGCLAIGALVAAFDTRRTHPLAGPFLGTGLLGGFTTFSAYAVETVDLIRSGHPAMACGYAAGTLIAAPIAVRLGSHLPRRRDGSP